MGRFQDTAFGRRAGKLGMDEAQALKLAQNRPDSLLGRLYSRAAPPGGSESVAMAPVDADGGGAVLKQLPARVPGGAPALSAPLGVAPPSGEEGNRLAPGPVMGRGRQPLGGGNMVRSDPNRNLVPPGTRPGINPMPFPEMVAGGGGRSVGMSPGGGSESVAMAPGSGGRYGGINPGGAPTLRTLPARIPGGGGPEMQALPFGPTPIPGGDLSMDPGMPPEPPSFRRVNPAAIQGLLQRLMAQGGGGASGRPIAEALGGGRPAF